MRTSLPALSVVLSLFAAALFAQPAPHPVPPAGPRSLAPQKPRTMDPAARSNLFAKIGGMIQTPATGPALLFLNTQKRVPAQALADVPGRIQGTLHLTCVTRDTPSAQPVTEALKALANTNIAAVIVIGDEAGYPALLLAPESRWALVNVAALGGPGVTAEKLADRVQKECWRAFAFLLGAADSAAENSLMKPVFSAADLDAIEAKGLNTEILSKFMVHAQKMGMKPARITTYRKAVEEGWAPAPTNEFQHAVWNELKKK